MEDSLPSTFPDDAIFIVGAGHFGSRAVRILGSHLRSPIWVFDIDRDALAQIDAPGVSKMRDDGIRFLAENYAILKSAHRIVPSLPRHLAFEWLRAHLGHESVTPVPVPQEINPFLPHTWPGPDGSLLVSDADFLCPEDCEEPETHCTVTGQRRGVPLHERLARLELDGYRTHIIRSRQLAPGVGGYPLAELTTLLGRLRDEPDTRWLVGTACRCHGVMTAFATSHSQTRSRLDSERQREEGIGFQL